MMNSNWYQQQQDQGGKPPFQTAGPSGTAVDAVHDAHRLLSVYPFASATPTNHGARLLGYMSGAYTYLLAVARHLSGLSLTATPPSYYVQPSTYSTYALSSQQYQYQSQYSEYAREVAHLASPSTPYNDGGYWEAQRNEAVRHLGQQGP